MAHVCQKVALGAIGPVRLFLGYRELCCSVRDEGLQPLVVLLKGVLRRQQLSNMPVERGLHSLLASQVLQGNDHPRPFGEIDTPAVDAHPETRAVGSLTGALGLIAATQSRWQKKHLNVSDGFGVAFGSD